MTDLETNLVEVLTREAVRFCSMVVRLFPARKCVGPSYGNFINGFAKKALAAQGRTGHMIRLHIPLYKINRAKQKHSVVPGTQLKLLMSFQL